MSHGRAGNLESSGERGGFPAESAWLLQDGETAPDVGEGAREGAGGAW